MPPVALIGNKMGHVMQQPRKLKTMMSLKYRTKRYPSMDE
jgi:hypothetical protein